MGRLVGGPRRVLPKKREYQSGVARKGDARYAMVAWICLPLGGHDAA